MEQFPIFLDKKKMKEKKENKKKKKKEKIKKMHYVISLFKFYQNMPFQLRARTDRKGIKMYRVTQLRLKKKHLIHQFLLMKSLF